VIRFKPAGVFGPVFARFDRFSARRPSRWRSGADGWMMDVSDIWVADDPCSISLSDDSSTLSVIVDSNRSTLTDTAVAVAVARLMTAPSRTHGYGAGGRVTGFSRAVRWSARAWLVCFCWPCVGESPLEPGDFMYRARILEYACARVKTLSEDADETRREMRLSGEYVARMVVGLGGGDVFACRARESEGTMEVEIRAGAHSRLRVMMVMASLVDSSGRPIACQLMEERLGERETIAC